MPNRFVSRRLIPSLIILILFSVFSSISQANSGSVITIDPSITYQTITGWEASASIGAIDFPNEFHKWQDESLDLAVNELGINRVRLPVRSGSENPRDYFGEYLNGSPRGAWSAERYTIINDNSDPNLIDPSGFNFTEMDMRIEHIVLPMKQEVEANGENLYVNLTYVDFEGSSFEHYSDPEEYAEFILASFLHMQNKYGFTPDAVEIILEPDNSNGWKHQDGGGGEQVGKALVATAERLKDEGFHPDFIAPSTEKSQNALPYVNEALAVPGVSQYLKEIAYHRYGKRPKEKLLEEISDFAKDNNVQTSMLERIGATYKDLHQDLQLANITAWQQFTLAYPTNDNGAQYFFVDMNNPSQPMVKIGEKTKFFQQYFKHIRSGALRIQAKSADRKLAPLAFINPDGTYVVVVKSDKERIFTVEGLPEGTYGLTYTTANAFKEDSGDITLSAGDILTASIPEEGVFTVSGIPQIVMPEPPPSPSQDGDDINVGAPHADFSVKMRASANTVQTGEDLTYSIRVTNNGPKGSRAKLMNKIPSSVNLKSVTPDHGRCESLSVRRLECRLGKLKVGESALVEIVVQPNSDLVLDNWVIVEGEKHDPVKGNNIARQRTIVVP